MSSQEVSQVNYSMISVILVSYLNLSCVVAFPYRTYDPTYCLVKQSDCTSFSLLLQAGPSLYLPSSNCSAQHGDPNSCPVHHFSLHRLHNGKPGLLAVHHCCLRPVSLCSFSCCWLCGIRVHGRRSSTCHGCRSTNSSTHNFCAVSSNTAAARPYAIETHLRKDFSGYEGMQRHGRGRENKGENNN